MTNLEFTCGDNSGYVVCDCGKRHFVFLGQWTQCDCGRRLVVDWESEMQECDDINEQIGVEVFYQWG